MKAIVLILLNLIFSTSLFAQSEFKTYSNGLIYSENTMAKLERIVDSLNLKYKSCDLNKVFLSVNQCIGHSVTLDTGNIIHAKKDIENNIPFESFVNKYPDAKIEKDILIIKSKYKNYREKDKEVVEYSEIAMNGYGNEITRGNENNIFNKDVKKTWAFNYVPKTDYSKESISAFYFPENFSSVPLKQKYARMIGYSDCLIDTVYEKIREDATEGWVDLPEHWESLSQKAKEKLLSEMRSTRVVGGCSEDSRPREHAKYIALLSAETTNWEIFLKSHLDIMNDRFERVIDGSYAWAERKTYLKELEELDINVCDLLIGISLRIENASEKHYYGNIGRTGRAMSESNNRAEFESTMLSMIEDPELDNYNRVLAYFLFNNYNHHLENTTDKNKNRDRLINSVAMLPASIKSKIKFKDE